MKDLSFQSSDTLSVGGVSRVALHDHCATARLAFLISDALRPVVHGLGLSTPHAKVFSI
jgi:hypothetical protein